MNTTGQVDKGAPLLPATLLLAFFPMFIVETVFDLTKDIWYPIGFLYGLFPPVDLVTLAQVVHTFLLVVFVPRSGSPRQSVEATLQPGQLQRLQTLSSRTCLPLLYRHSQSNRRNAGHLFGLFWLQRSLSIC